jgi:hypothetical protein
MQRRNIVKLIMWSESLLICNTIVNHKLSLELPVTKFATSDIVDLKFYRDRILNDNSCTSVSIFAGIGDKKSFIKQCTIASPEIYQQLSNLSDSYWESFNSQQLLLVAQMLGQLPVISEKITTDNSSENGKNTKPLITSKKNNSTFSIIDHTFDCLRFNVALAGLRSSNQLGIVQVATSKVNEANTKYFELTDKMGPQFERQLAAFVKVGFSPISNQIYSHTNYQQQLEIGDVIYFIPIQDGFVDRQGYLNHRLDIQRLNLIEKLQQLLLYKNVKSVNLLSKSDLNIVMQELHNDQEQLLEYISPYELRDLKESFQLELNRYKDQKFSQMELNTTRIKLKTSINLTNTRIKKFQESHTRLTSQGKVAVEAANYHYVTVVDKAESSIKVVQIDGANPLIPMSIENVDGIIGKSEKIVILRNGRK